MKHDKLSRRAFLASGAAIGALGLAGGRPTAVFAQNTSVLRLRLDGDNKILDPGYMIGGTEVEAQKQCLPFLAQYTRDGDTFGWEPTYFVTKLEQRTPTAIDFELTEGLEWSNGYGPLKASDVKYSYERMKGTDWGGYFDAMDHVEVTGDRTGTIVLNKPFAPFFMVTLCHGPGAILCEKATEDAGGKFTTSFPAVCGPYTYDSVPGQNATFSANPEWTGPKPAYDKVVLNVISEVKAAELAFEAGELDCTELGSDTLARYAQAKPEGSAITTAGELQYMWMGMNTEHPKLQNKAVRQAIQHAVDVESILAGAFSGTSAKSAGIVCPGLVGHRDATKSYSYDPAKAQQLMAESGETGLTLSLRTLNTQERMLTAQIIQANLAVIGITVEILPLDSGPFWEMGSEAAGDTWQDLQLWTMRFAGTPDPYEAAQWFVSSQVGVWNWERWTDPEYDRLYDEGLVETDVQKRAEIYRRMQDIMEETGAYVWINHEPEVYIHDANVVISAAPSGELDYRRFSPA